MRASIQNVAVKSLMALEWGKSWATSGELTHRKAFLLGAVLAAAMMAGDALAAPPTGADTKDTNGEKNPIDQVRIAICSVAGVLQGPIGVGVIIACIVVAGLSMAFGGKQSTSLLISALIGACIVFGARTLIGFVAGGTSGSQACAIQ
jgi:type IV secretory pathway VirB2 component (pilin)